MTEDSPSWRWDEERWRKHVDVIRAGRRLVPPVWPGGAKVAVALSFDADHETIPLRDNEIGPGKLSQGEFGSRVGSRRILELLERYQLPATVFMPGVSALLHPDELREYVSRGFEIGLHSWIHERNTALPAADERELAFRSMDVLEKIAGVRPVGVRTASWEFSAATLAITQELGLIYDSSLMADDDPYEINSNGVPTGIVEIPVEWIRDDAVYFPMDRFSDLRPYASPREVLNTWIGEFEGACSEGGLFQLTLHPHVIGHRARMRLLEELFDHMKSRDGVWFATHEQVASYVLENC